MPADKKTIALIRRLRAAVLVLVAALLTTGAFAHQQIRRAGHAQHLVHKLRKAPAPPCEKKAESYSRQEVMELEWELYRQRALAEE